MKVCILRGKWKEGKNEWQYNTIQYNKDTLLIFKNGKFYNCYKDDAIIINYLFGYKILKDEKSGFPENSLTKVTTTLEDKKINYQIIFKDYNPITKKYDKLNNYHKILKKALEYNEIQIRVRRLQEKIDEITDLDLLEKIIGVLEDELQRR